MHRIQIFPHPQQYLLILLCCCFGLVVLFCCESTGYKVVTPGGLTSISLMINDVERLLLCLAVICTSSLEKCLFKSSAQLYIGLFVVVVELYNQRLD